MNRMETNKMPTAEELHGKFLREHQRKDGHCFQECMKEFARLHVRACKEEIARDIKQKDKLEKYPDSWACPGGGSEWVKESILNAYPEDNIK